MKPSLREDDLRGILLLLCFITNVMSPSFGGMS